MADDDSIADRMTRLLDELESLPASERVAALDTLTPEERDVLATLAGQRAAFYGDRAKANADMAETHRWVAGVDLLEVLDAGQDGIGELHKATQPTGLLELIDRVAKDDPRAVVAALFAAVVLSDEGGSNEKSPTILDLRKQWGRHVRKQIREQGTQDIDDRDGSP